MDSATLLDDSCTMQAEISSYFNFDTTSTTVGSNMDPKQHLRGIRHLYH